MVGLLAPGVTGEMGVGGVAREGAELLEVAVRLLPEEAGLREMFQGNAEGRMKSEEM